MTSPTLVYRELTVNFARSVNADQTPQILQVVVTPLSTPTSAPAGAVFVEAPVARDVLLGNTVNDVVFRLVPSDLAGLTERLLYRIAWRTGGVTGRTFTYDFAMPDADLTFEQLNSLNYIIGGEVYLQQADLGVPGRIARLNDAGQVIDAFGTPVAGASNVTALENALNAERVERQSADNQIQTQLTTELNSQVNQIITTTGNTINAARSELGNQISVETQARIAADVAQNTALASKADLLNGKVPLSQIPDAARTQGVQVADQAAMLALTLSQVQQFDFAIRPDGVFALLGTDPSQLSHWAKLNRVSSVNGLEGEIVLDLTAVSQAGGAVPQAQVTGLTAALSGKADGTALTLATSRITAIENDATIVKTVDGVIPHTLNNTRMAYLDATGQFITRKDGTIISGAGGAVGSVNGEVGNVVLDLSDIAAAGGAIAQSQVTGLTTAINGKVDTTDARLSDTRTPTTHAASHGAAGSDPVTLATSQVTGLATTLTNYNNRLGSLETRVTTIETNGGGGGGGGNVGTLNWFSAPAPTGDFSTLTLHSPFGYSPLNVFANAQGFYYNPAGADTAEVRFPYITPNGHLELRKWDESAPADPVLATQNDLSALTTTVNGKASQADLTALTTTVNGKASQATVDSLTTTVNAKASQAAVDSLTTTVAGKASQAAVDLKADTATVSVLSTTVSSHTTTLSAKADLSGGKVPVAQIPTGIPQANISGLTTALSGKADLSGGVLVLTQVPTGIPQSRIENLTTTLSNKADLVDGKVATSQLPSLSLTSVQVVTARSAMLALNSTQVQPGDICVITATADQGSYILTDPDPSVFTNWTLLANPLASVLSVNGQTGTVVLTAANVGALASNASIPQSQVTNLGTTLASKVDTSTYTTAINNRPTWNTPSQTLEAILTAAVPAKQRVTYVASTSVASLSGQQSADGVIMALGSTVLLTAQASSVLNGIWQVNSGAWTRVPDMASGSYLVKGTIVVVSSGTTNANTLWQATSTSGVVDTAVNNWTKIGNVGAAYVATAGNGIEVTGSSPAQTIAVKPAPATTVGSGTTADPYVQQSSGISVSSSGVAVDTTIVARKFVGNVPSGSATPRIYHNLNTRRVLVQVQEVSTGVGVLVGWQASANNYIDLEFSAAPSSGQWAVIVIG